jgi:hypothetical protein
MTPELAQMAVAAGIPLAGLSAAALPSQATRHARRIYVGGLPPAANEASVAKFFSTALAAVGGAETAGDSVVNVYINNEKKFAFVEFRTVGSSSLGRNSAGGGMWAESDWVLGRAEKRALSTGRWLPKLM